MVSLWREDKPIAKPGSLLSLDDSLKRVRLKPRRRGLWWLHVSTEHVSVGSELRWIPLCVYHACHAGMLGGPFERRKNSLVTDLEGVQLIKQLNMQAGAAI
jgi:hypothetical protein